MTIRNIDTLYWYHAIQDFYSFDKYKMQLFEGILWNETERNKITTTQWWLSDHTSKMDIQDIILKNCTKRNKVEIVCFFLLES